MRLKVLGPFSSVDSMAFITTGLKKHCDRYVDESTFRLNEDNCQIDTLDRVKSLYKGMSGQRIKYKELIA